MTAKVYLIPTVLAEGVTDPLPAYILPAIKACSELYVENERTARRYLKLLDRTIVIDDFKWHSMTQEKPAMLQAFQQALSAGRTVGIISEAGCPGIADPGQELVAIAQEKGATVTPLTGPNSILLALMASGLNGQAFSFHGYLPINASERTQRIRALEAESRSKGATEIFIETPYRNNQMMESLVNTLHPQTRICVAADITAPAEFIQTKTAAQWKTKLPELHKRPVIFLILAG